MTSTFARASLLAALSEPSALLEGPIVHVNDAWRALEMPTKAEAVVAMLSKRPADRSRFETPWGMAEVAKLDGADLVRIVRAADARSILEGSDYRAVFEVTTDAIFVYDDEYNLVDVNPAACKLHGWTREEMLAMHPSQFIHESAHGVFHDFVETLRTKPFFRGLARGLCKDGSTFDVEVYGVPLFIRGKRHSISSVRDITHLQDTQRALEASEARVRRALEASQSAYWEVDLGSGACIASDQCVALFGRAIEDVSNWLSLGHEEDRAQLEKAWTAHVAGKTERVLAERRIETDDGWRWLDERAWVAGRDDNGEPTLVVGHAVDITERKRMEQRMLHGMRLESLGRMAGGVAHDFNNLLTVIFGGAELARTTVPDGTESAEDIDSIIDAAERARRLTDQLLTFSRRQISESSVLETAHELESIKPVLDRLVGSRVELRIQTAPDLWKVQMDPTRFEQVIVNLAVNAKDAMPAGGTFDIEADNVFLDQSYVDAHPEVSVGAYVRLSVTDAGTGMRRDVVERIFEPFFTTKTRGRGTGLGLATVYGAVQQAGGHVWVYSELGQGTSFRIYLPRSTNEVTLSLPNPEADVAPLSGTEQILVVEDDDAVRKVATIALERRGYRVTQAASGEEAYRIFEARAASWDLVVTDVMLGDINGRELAERLRGPRPNLPLLFVSGYTENTIVKGGILDENVDFLPKPYAPDELLRTVRRILDRSA